MNRETLPPSPISDGDSEAVERQYGEYGLLYAETRSEVAQSLGREEAARQWQEVQTEIETKRDGRLMRVLPIARWIMFSSVASYIAIFAVSQLGFFDSRTLLYLGLLAAVAMVLGGSVEVVMALRRPRR